MIVGEHASGKRDFAGAGRLLGRVWGALSPLPGGKALFSGILGLVNPYTGSIGAQFDELRPGYARVRLRERRRVRNHVGSIHAIALMNLAEVTSGLALMSGLAPGVRGIPVELGIVYHRKARGEVVAECCCEPPRSAERQEVELECVIRDHGGEQIATARARWVVGG